MHTKRTIVSTAAIMVALIASYVAVLSPVFLA